MTHAAPHQIDVDELANEIRRIDGNHDMGAGALAEALMPFLSRTAPVSEGELEKAWGAFMKAHSSPSGQLTCRLGNIFKGGWDAALSASPRPAEGWR
jgi:hypothetical protein